MMAAIFIINVFKSMTRQRKAVALISGGLDSMLAAKLMIDQGIHVEGINFYTGFCVEGHTQAIRGSQKPKRNNALWVAEQLGIPLHIVDVSEPYKDVVINPKYGYGANLNPCLDCKIFMVGEAKKWMEENQFDFIITGEVMGQRPMSQRKDTFPVVAKRSGIEDRIVRPLCARLCEPTLPEREGWIDREQLLDISGRSRKMQMALAEKYALNDYAQPAGGCCFLTDPNYTQKLKDLWQARGERKYELDDIVLLKVGRHFRMRNYFKIIVAREEGENNYMEGYKRQFAHAWCTSHTGPLALIDGQPMPQDLEEVARLIGRYCRGKNESEVTVCIQLLNQPAQVMKVKPFAADEVAKEWLL